MAITLTTDIPEDRTLEVAIFTSEECEVCVMYSDFLTAEDTPHTLELATEKSKNYTIVVSGEGFADVGVFQLELEVSFI
jgi:predicted DCC family thiol-disulfide oxidoreductase YuxK